MSERFFNPVNTEIVLLLQDCSDAATVKLGQVGVTKAKSGVQRTLTV